MNFTVSNYYFLIFMPLVSVVQTHAQNNDHVFVSTVIPEIVVSGGLSVDSAGNIYASDSRGGEGDPTGKRIYKITPDRKTQVFTNDVFGPSGSTIGPNGELYVSNYDSSSISRISMDGKAHIFAKNIPKPGGIVFDNTGNLYTPNFGDRLNRTSIGCSISKVTPNGDVSIFVTSKLLNGPLGLTIDMQGNLYATNWHDRKIVQITPEKRISILATLPGSEGQPIVHIVFWAGNLYVAGGNTWKVFKVSRDGKVSILAGTEKPGSQDGSPRSASFGFVNGIAVSEPANALIVLDILPNTSRDGPLGVYGRIRAIHFSQ